MANRSPGDSIGVVSDSVDHLDPGAHRGIDPGDQIGDRRRAPGGPLVEDLTESTWAPHPVPATFRPRSTASPSEIDDTIGAVVADVGPGRLAGAHGSDPGGTTSPADPALQVDHGGVDPAVEDGDHGTVGVGQAHAVGSWVRSMCQAPRPPQVTGPCSTVVGRLGREHGAPAPPRPPAGSAARAWASAGVSSARAAWSSSA